MEEPMNSPESPDEKQPNYLWIFITLAVITAIEVGITFLPVRRIFFLIPLAVIKAALVVMYFMHLKFDKRVFTVIFIMGVLMGVSLIISMTFLFLPLK
jgi:cytochrome c oxidase subunit IV